MKNLLFHNAGNRRLANVSAEAGPAFAMDQIGRGAAFGDIDNDGDTDVLIANLNGPARLLVNNVGNRSHWVGLRLIGSGGSGGRDMLGARVEIRQQKGPTLWRRVRSDGSYASANDPRVIVGLGQATAAPAAVRVRWPNGNLEEWSDVNIDRWTTLKEGSGKRR
jgi:hypothetical protein